jgi:FKBP-type peptidyl-prolyl cis-trans isomerase FkpA
MKKNILMTMSLLVLVFTFAGCSKNSAKKQAETDHNLILNYVSAHNLKGEFTSSGLYYVIQDSGTAKHPTLSANLNVNYKGYFLDGKIFDQGAGVKFPLSGVIKGWQEGLQLIGVGGKIKLLIPSALGYGNTQSGSIPPNSVLGFDVTLNSFSK